MIGHRPPTTHRPAHTRCNNNLIQVTRDLDVITAKTLHAIFTVVGPTSLITDHYAVECGLLQSKPNSLKRHVICRKYSAINNSNFVADLKSFNINADEADPVALLAGYDTCLRTVIDAHAPLVSRIITLRSMTPYVAHQRPGRGKASPPSCGFGGNKA